MIHKPATNQELPGWLNGTINTNPEMLYPEAINTNIKCPYLFIKL